MNRLLMRVGLVLVLMLSAAVSLAQAPEDALLAERLRAHIEFLADDALAGRQPGTEGYTVAANYVASQYRQLGLQPAGEGGTFFQSVPLRRAWLVEGSAQLALVRAGVRQDYRYLDEFYFGPSLGHQAGEVEAEMVFVGYGIDAPALAHDDYARADVRGKVAVMLAGKPVEFPSEEGAHFGSGREKTRAALAHGAVAVLTVYTPRTEKVFAWERVRSLVGTPSMGWLNAAGEVPAAPPGLRGEATVHYAAAGTLFEGSDISLDDLLQRDQDGEPLPAGPLAGSVRMAQQSRHERIDSPNVAAVLPGSDPLLAGEYLIYTAHLDHIGTLAGHGHDDAINNGALDNASGVAVMLETARLFTSKPPRRSLMFLAVTAEEKGLVGSEYFAQHPTVPADKMAAVINLDMPLLLYEFGDVIAFGAEHSTLGEAAAQAAGEAGVALTPDPFPDQSIFVRSDHYRFVQQGVPAIFLVTGPTALDGVTDTLPLYEGFLQKHYHMPSDDLSLPINYNAAARFTRINARIGALVSDAAQAPRWHEGSFFGDTFAAP